MTRFLVLGSNSFSGATFCGHLAVALEPPRQPSAG
jgi:hypothetical protein